MLLAVVYFLCKSPPPSFLLNNGRFRQRPLLKESSVVVCDGAGIYFRFCVCSEEDISRVCKALILYPTTLLTAEHSEITKQEFLVSRTYPKVVSSISTKVIKPWLNKITLTQGCNVVEIEMK